MRDHVYTLIEIDFLCREEAEIGLRETMEVETAIRRRLESNIKRLEKELRIQKKKSHDLGPRIPRRLFSVHQDTRCSIPSCPACFIFQCAAGHALIYACEMREWTGFASCVVSL